jgi:predicted metal-dependent hydrolase
MTVRSRKSGQPRSTLLGQRQVDYVLQRSAKRRTIGLRVDGGGLRVSAPAWTPDAEIDSVLHAHARWIFDKLNHWQHESDLPSARCFADGSPLLWLGRSVPIRRVAARDAIPVAVGPEDGLQAIPLALECEDPLAAITAWYVAQAAPWFRRRTLTFAERLGVAPREIRLTSARGRWGSCTGKGVIRLNWRLMQASPAEIDYVVAHEMAHLIELNHSPSFWQTVARIYPEWSASSDLLDANDRIYRQI